ncbi:MAG: bifunctional pyr operon transcriptional regulator/uracil phosphoribosyltransferase PyrR [Lachnospiraceae bacterium]|nr:bifunctional pyr operon transcriptional regulator/uracil phosphoribosyltransferase PyrR [Lachnospiraceae bacterium]MBR4767469.1 bifunctional pyr operon transcriptional regulator/uracil phosphoribosyltransferase PyrR [Lachnospiraceae bacterium]
MSEKVIVNGETMARMIARLSHEIIEQNPGEETVYLVGIKRRGVPIARRIRENIERFSDLKAESGELDITLYRDDLTERYTEPHVNSSVIPFDVTGKRIVLVDDVLYTGRTTRAAMDAVIRLGRPAKIQLAVLVDRGHRELPISANYVGKNIPTSKREFVSVRVTEIDGKDEIALSERE